MKRLTSQVKAKLVEVTKLECTLRASSGIDTIAGWAYPNHSDEFLRSRWAILDRALEVGIG